MNGRRAPQQPERQRRIGLLRWTSHRLDARAAWGSSGLTRFLVPVRLVPHRDIFLCVPFARSPLPLPIWRTV